MINDKKEEQVDEALDESFPASDPPSWMSSPGPAIAPKGEAGGNDMATMVGTQRGLSTLLNSLIEIDLDAIEAYRVAIERLKDANDKAQLASFMADHERHVRELRPLVQQLGAQPANAPDIKAVFTRGKVQIGSLFGDRTILRAMKTNEDDTNRAYERATARQDLPAVMREVLQRSLADERRHREYISGRLRATEEHVAHR